MRILIGAWLLLAASPGLAQAQQQQSGADRLGDKAENIVRQPVKDVGLMRENPPEVLKDAQRAPYSLAGIKRCQDIRRAIGELDVVLGPDVDAVDEKGDALPERLAEAGAKSIVNSLIPFRGIVREATGAAEADRKFRMMVAAGMARRGFLKGIAKERNCPV
ncbi:hypothetical protein [Sandaracinobacter sp.]|uniref:hypothetical protein n=1 Tax=Sandaracinobacter sp. TaxID=2487581 RepID=UPI0035B40D4E